MRTSDRGDRLWCSHLTTHLIGFFIHVWKHFLKCIFKKRAVKTSTLLCPALSESSPQKASRWQYYVRPHPPSKTSIFGNPKMLRAQRPKEWREKPFPYFSLGSQAPIRRSLPVTEEATGKRRYTLSPPRSKQQRCEDASPVRCHSENTTASTPNRRQ